MQVRPFIEAKRNGRTHPSGAIRQFIEHLPEIPDYQISAWLMAVFFQGLDANELSELTTAMAESGRIFSKSRQIFRVDKHSTGGVGDKSSLILVPLVASTAERLWGHGALQIPMISGRGLGHTGGTLDKLESVPGFRTQLSFIECETLLSKQGFFMSGQTEDFVPADRKLYALRDVTATVESLPLIVSSIMSKKLAEGLDGVVIDLKCGSGAFIRSLPEARALASRLLENSIHHSLDSQIWITDMNEPLGRCVGNILEVKECRDLLENPSVSDSGLKEVTLTLAASMLTMASRKRLSLTQARGELENTLDSREALTTFDEMLCAQGGSIQGLLQKASRARSMNPIEIRAKHSGYIQSIEARAVGELLVQIGGGRKTVVDKVNPYVGFEFHKKVGDKVAKEEIVVTGYLADEIQSGFVEELLRSIITIGQDFTPPTQWIMEPGIAP